MSARLFLLRSPLIAVALATVMSGAAVLPASAQNLQWQRGAASKSDSSIAEAHFVSPTSGRATSAAEPSAIQQVAFEDPWITEEPVRRPAAARPAGRPAAKRPASRIAAATGPGADFGAFVERAVGSDESFEEGGVEPASFGCSPMACGAGICEGPTCGCIEPGCEYVEPGCACGEPGCGCIDGGCGEVLYGDCSCGDATCSDCVGQYGVPGSWGRCDERGAIPLYIYLPPIKEIVLFGGVQGFKGPLDYNPTGRDNNFGFHEGVNVGGKMSWLPIHGLGYQVGYQATQNQLSGDAANSSSSHSQHFVTVGLFNRKKIGWQYGVVWDQMQDSRQTNNDYRQMRGLISFKNHFCHEFGFEFASGTHEKMVGTFLYEPADQYKLFWRRQGQTGGEFRSFIGSSGDNHLILGADLAAPLNHRWSIETGFTYFAPTDGGDGRYAGGIATSPDATEEGVETSASTWFGTSRAAVANGIAAPGVRCSMWPTTGRWWSTTATNRPPASRPLPRHRAAV